MSDTNSAIEFESYYDYPISEVSCYAFLVLFGVLTLLHFGLVIKTRKWWMLTAVVGGAGEIIGWIGRYLNVDKPADRTAFIIQQACLVISPCFYSAAVYCSLGVLVRLRGPGSSRFSAKAIVITFCLMDLFAIAIQSAGGGLAAGDDDDSSQLGTNIFVAGIAVQAVGMALFDVLAFDVLRRARKMDTFPSTDCKITASSIAGLFQGRTLSPGQGNRFLVSGIVSASVFIMIRQIYRLIELAQGWNGWLMAREGYFLALDSTPMMMTMICLLLFYPKFTVATHLHSGHAMNSINSSSNKLV